MKIDAWLKASTALLASAGVSTGRLDCLVLLEDTLNTNRTQLLAHPELDLTGVELNTLNGMVQKRAQHIPLAHLRGKTEFYGREFIINEHVLEPRPESETMIDMFKALPLPKRPRVADIGSGSGALGITIALEVPNAELSLIEIDSNALAVSQQNVAKYNIRVQLVQNDLLDELDEQFDVLLCNLPYVPKDFRINTAASHEPAIAIFGGPDGLDVYRRLFTQVTTRKHVPKYVLAESLPPQHEQLADIASKAGFTAVKDEDFIQLFELI
jgi:release factor glutamine methyltransferase